MDFKVNCRNELRELDGVLQQLKRNVLKDDSDSVRNASLEANQHLINVRLELADLNRQIAVQQRLLDNVPAQIEISQYQRRIIELYNQSLLFEMSRKSYFGEMDFHNRFYPSAECFYA